MSSSLAWSDEVEVAADVIVRAGRDLVLVDLLFGTRAVLAVNFLVAASAEFLLRRAEDDLAAACALPGVVGDGLRVDRPQPLRVRRVLAGDVRVMPGAPVFALAWIGSARLVALLPLLLLPL